MTALNDTLAWRALEAHVPEAKTFSIQNLLENEEARMDALSFELGGLYFDFSKHLVNVDTLELLIELAVQQDVSGNFTRMISGDIMNISEGRAALHTQLRAKKPLADVQAVLDQIKQVALNMRADSSIRDVVHIGVGGSDLGPRLVCDALGTEVTHPRVHFVGNVDPQDLESVLKFLNPHETLFVVASKTFTTRETMVNFERARGWAGGEMHRFLASTVNQDAALHLGIPAQNIFPMWDWVGGRFSLWSSVGLTIALAYGFETFSELLRGASLVDEHVLNTPYARNIPVIMALLGVWYRNFMGAGGHAILPYNHRLSYLPSYLQQLEMESNGKSVTREGMHIQYETAPVVFGGVGTNAQHAFMQVLYQGTSLIPCDFIGVANSDDTLMANMLAQSRSLMLGCTGDAHVAIAGNRPSSTIVMPVLDAYHLGILLAVFEHKTVAQGFLWNINSFDQQGVELGKRLVKDLLAHMNEVPQNNSLDKSTSKLIFHTFMRK